MRPTALVSVAVLSMTALACGLDLDGAATPDAGIAHDGSVAFDATSDFDAGGVADGGGANDATTGADSAKPDGASGSDANVVDASTDSGALDAGRDANDSGTVSGQIHCGTGNCNLATEICCKAAGLYTCLLRGVVCTGATIECDERADCPSSDVWCAKLDGQGRLQQVSCVAPQTCNGNATELCNPDAGTCPNGTTCQPTSPELQGDFECN